MNDETIQLAHGGGGRLTRALIDREIVPRFGGGPLEGLPDSARLRAPVGALLFTTDSFVVHPLEFPGGNIGALAVHGSVNDIAVAGGKPLWLSVGLIVEEGLPLAVLRRILDSLRAAADAAGVRVVTGDTKVVARGECDGLYINTAAIGEPVPGFNLSAGFIEDGDAVLVSGPVGDHGMAVLAAREGIAVENGPLSDTAPVHRLVAAIGAAAPHVRFMRDPTRGGLAAVLNELVDGRPVGIVLDENAVPLSSGGRAVAELLGLDPLQIACEGRVICVCAAAAADDILACWRTLPEGAHAGIIGRAAQTAGSVSAAGRVMLNTAAGGRRLVDVPRGELLPRIC